VNKQQRGSWTPTLLLFFLFLGLRLSGVDDWNMFWVFSPLIIGGGIFAISFAIAVHKILMIQRAATEGIAAMAQRYISDSEDPFKLN
jgi:TRAP-type C4-dicarboxylate transport system permease small subunit